MPLRAKITPPADRYLGPDPAQREIARTLYNQVANLPLVCPHGHVDPRLLSDPDYRFGSPADLLFIPDHYVFRMLYSQGIPMEKLGIPGADGLAVEQDHRKIWQLFAENFYLFRGTPTGLWITQELYQVFGVDEKLTGESAQDIFDHVSACLEKPEFRPRRLFEQFNIEVLATTDSPIDTLEHHRAIRESGWPGRVIPTFRPDDLINLNTPGWRANIVRLSEVSGIDITNYAGFIRALENRRAFFREMGATAGDYSAETAFTVELSAREAETTFQRALKGQQTAADAVRFTGHLFMEMARMSIEDGLVMQLHTGIVRNHNSRIFERFGRDAGGDIPLRNNFTQNLRPLLNKYGNHPGFRLIVFSLDEGTYTRELAPLAGHYPALRLGPPWWYYDSLTGIRRYLDYVTETAGLQNLAGFNDDTRAFPSIPIRHDVWRRVTSNWVAGLVLRGAVDMADARGMAYDLAYRLAKRAYNLD